MLFLSDRLYLTGGDDGSCWVSRWADALDLKSGRSIRLPKMRTLRRQHTTVASDRHLLVFGGYLNELRHTRSECELFDPSISAYVL